MSTPIITGLLAYGMSGRIFHAPFIHAHSGFQLHAVVERSKKTVAELYPGVVSYDSVDDILNDEKIELIIVNTPSYTHYEFAKQALLAGKHVLIEKPAAQKLEQVMELFELAKEKDLKVMIYQNRRWDSDFLAVKSVIESGRLGDLIEVNFRFDRYKPVLSPKRFKEDKAFVANGLVYDLGPHLLDQIISLFGRPVSYHKVEATHREGSEVVDYFSFQLSYPHQLNVNVTSNLLTAQPMPSFIVHGTLGSFLKERCDVQEEQLDKAIKPTDPEYGLEPANSEGKLVLMSYDGQKLTELVPSLKGDYTHLFEAAYHTIRNNALFPISEEHIAWQMELLEA